VARLRKKYPKGVYVTAATGIAAVNIGGVTLHSFAGIRLGQGSAQALAASVMRCKKFVKRWNQCKVLIVDEISMIDSDLFEKVDSYSFSNHPLILPNLRIII
jgi:ATP-dependent DNA helicase PIF1